MIGMEKKTPPAVRLPVTPSKAMQKMRDRILKQSLDTHNPLGEA
jgi:hypothetical protein